jgi:RNA-directed DNA polymerase
MRAGAITKTRRVRGASSRKPRRPQAPLPVGAQEDEQLMGALRGLEAGFPGTLGEMLKLLAAHETKVTFEAGARWVHGVIKGRFEEVARLEDGAARALFLHAERCGDEGLRARIFRALLARPERWLRRRIGRALASRPPQDVALPTAQPQSVWTGVRARVRALGGPPQETQQTAWGWQGWFHGRDEAASALTQHPAGEQRQQAAGVPLLETVADVRALLGIPSTRALGWLLAACGPTNAAGESFEGVEGPYRCFTIPKRGGGVRLICEPKPPLKRVQRLILSKILEPLGVHDAAHGFMPGRSILTNASAHAAHDVVVKFDLQDFFPSVHFWRVMGLFASLGYAVGEGRYVSDDGSRAVAPVLARLATFTPEPLRKRWGSGFLAQGAPTSPAISNLVCRGLDARLAGIAAKLGGVYTRYADDMTFSFAHLDPDKSPGRLRWWVDQVCQQEGFLLHPRKFKVIRRSQRQIVTGLVVNAQAPSLPREDRRRLRAILHNCAAKGVASQAKGDPAFLDRLHGDVSYLQMVHPEEGRKLRTLLDALSQQPTQPRPEDTAP